MTNITRLWSETARGPSPRLWGDLVQHQHDMFVGHGLFFFDDFVNPANFSSATSQNGYYTYQDTGVNINGIAGPPTLNTEQGVLQVLHDGTDNDEGHIQLGGANTGQFQIDANTTGNTGELFFEARLTKNSVANNEGGFFLGLTTPPVAADYLVDDTSALKAADFIGFHVLQDAGSEVDLVYRSTGGSLQTVNANATAMTANTYVKLGLHYNPNAIDAEKRIQFYIDGVPSTNTVNATNINSANFPQGNALTLAFLTKLGSGTAVQYKLDWWAISQKTGV